MPSHPQSLSRACAGLALTVLCLLPAYSQPHPPPNILVAIADDWSAGHAGAYGCSWIKTPAFDRIASEGVIFTRAYTPNAKCAPSRACLLTGRNSWQLGAAANHVPFFPSEFKTYPEALSEQGYIAGFTAKGWAPGVAKDAQNKPRQLTGQPYNRRTLRPPTSSISNNDYAGNFNDFLQAVPQGKPWCFWFGSLEPHRSYEYQSGVLKGNHSTSDIPRVPAYWPDSETVRNDMLDYAFEVEHFDHHLNRMLDLLDQYGIADNTLIVVTSDHGMPFPRVKGQAYDASNHIPLAIRWPRGIAHPGRTIHDHVSLIDLAPTFLEVTSLPWPASGMAPAQGLSLTDLLSTELSGWINPQRNHVLLGKERHDVGRPNDQGYPIRGIIQDNLLLIQNFEPERWPAGNPETGYLNCDGGAAKTEILELRRTNGTDPFWDLCFGKRPAVELYDLLSDPDCVQNLAPEHAYQQRLHELSSYLHSQLLAQEDPRALGQGQIFDAYPYANPDHQNFYQRYLAGEELHAGWVNPSDFEREPVPSR
jgi:N-sulfoglucosamine sulfohydrolase